MTAEPTDTFTSEQAYELLLNDGAVVRIAGRSAFVFIGGRECAISDPLEIKEWLKIDLQKGDAVLLSATVGKPETLGRFQHVAHAPKKAEQAVLIPLAPVQKKA